MAIIAAVILVIETKTGKFEREALIRNRSAIEPAVFNAITDQMSASR